MVSVTLLADSVNPNGDRLTTFEVEVPKYLLGQLAKHRQLSMNFESSRAKPFWKVLKQVCEEPYIPQQFGKPTSGMQPNGYYEHGSADHAEAEYGWGFARSMAVKSAIYAGYHWYENSDEVRDLIRYVLDSEHSYEMFAGDAIALDWDWLAKNPPLVAKETLNRILEPYMMVSGIVSATEWTNFLELRTDSAAQSDIQYLANDIRDLLDSHVPTLVDWGENHIPLGNNIVDAVERIARVSYGNHHRDSKRATGELFTQLSDSNHWSPFEHVAQAGKATQGNFNGWIQLRHTLTTNRRELCLNSETQLQ